MKPATHTPARPRSGPAIRAVLAVWAPGKVPKFVDEFRQALIEAARSFDLAPCENLLERWRRVATLRANLLTPEEQEQVRRAHAGDYIGL